MPGILTGIAALITAIGGIWVIYSTTNNAALPTIESFGANSQEIVSGDNSTLSWSVFDATDISITPGTGSLPLSGSMKVHPIQTTTYILKASNKHGSTQATTVVSVETNNVPANVPVIESFRVSSEKILSGENAALSWSVSGATSVTITPEVGNVQSDGSILVSPTQTTIYVLTATNEAGSVKATTVVSVDKKVDFPTIDSFSASPEEIAYGQSSILSWNVSGATSVNIAPEIGDVPLSGSRTVHPAQNTVYTIKAANNAGSVKATTDVVVNESVAASDLKLPIIIGTTRKTININYSNLIAINNSFSTM